MVVVVDVVDEVVVVGVVQEFLLNDRRGDSFVDDVVVVAGELHKADSVVLGVFHNGIRVVVLHNGDRVVVVVGVAVVAVAVVGVDTKTPC